MSKARFVTALFAALLSTVVALTVASPALAVACVTSPNTAESGGYRSTGSVAIGSEFSANVKIDSDTILAGGNVRTMLELGGASSLQVGVRDDGGDLYSYIEYNGVVKATDYTSVKGTFYSAWITRDSANTWTAHTRGINWGINDSGLTSGYKEFYTASRTGNTYSCNSIQSWESSTYPWGTGAMQKMTFVFNPYIITNIGANSFEVKNG